MIWNKDVDVYIYSIMQFWFYKVIMERHYRKIKQYTSNDEQNLHFNVPRALYKFDTPVFEHHWAKSPRDQMPNLFEKFVDVWIQIH